MKISQKGVDLIKRFEGCRLAAYKPVKTEVYYTIGWGHYGPDVAPGAKITQAQADALLLRDLVKYENAVNGLGRKWTQGQFDALVSFAYNCGAGNLQKLTEGRSPDIISDKLLLYNKAGGKTLAGLVKRRAAEKALFDSDPAEPDQIDQIAREVIQGLWGNGLIRRARLTAAGYDYKTVQARVNALLRG